MNSCNSSKTHHFLKEDLYKLYNYIYIYIYIYIYTYIYIASNYLFRHGAYFLQHSLDKPGIHLLDEPVPVFWSYDYDWLIYGSGSNCVEKNQQFKHGNMTSAYKGAMIVL